VEGKVEDVLRNITLLLRRFGAAVVVCHPDAGRAVQLANDLDLMRWCTYSIISLTSLYPSYFLNLPENGFDRTTWKPSPAGWGATIRGMMKYVYVLGSDKFQMVV
jgi:hypothetical protein